jgi:hypothetical protein
MRGLDPRIHHSSQGVFAKRMDRRVKPGDDSPFLGYDLK